MSSTMSRTIIRRPSNASFSQCTSVYEEHIHMLSCVCMCHVHVQYANIHFTPHKPHYSNISLQRSHPSQLTPHISLYSLLTYHALVDQHLVHLAPLNNPPLFAAHRHKLHHKRFFQGPRSQYVSLLPHHYMYIE